MRSLKSTSIIRRPARFSDILRYFHAKLRERLIPAKTTQAVYSISQKLSERGKIRPVSAQNLEETRLKYVGYWKE